MAVEARKVGCQVTLQTCPMSTIGSVAECRLCSDQVIKLTVGYQALSCVRWASAFGVDSRPSGQTGLEFFS